MEMRTLVGSVLEPQLSAAASTSTSMFGFRLPAFECESLTASQRSEGDKGVTSGQPEMEREQDESPALTAKDEQVDREPTEDENFCIDIETEDEHKPEIFPALNVQENSVKSTVGSCSYNPSKFHLFPHSMERMEDTTEINGQDVL